MGSARRWRAGFLAGVAAIGLLVAGPGRVLGADVPPATPAAVAAAGVAAAEEARRMSPLLPTVKDLHRDDALGTWKLPWELQIGLLMRVPTEEAFWAQMREQSVPAGIDASVAKAILENWVATIAASGGAAQGVGPREAAAMSLLMLRNSNPSLARRMEEEMLAGVRVAAAGMAAKDDPARAQKEMLAATLQPLNGLTQAHLTDAFVREATLVRRRTMMVYFKSNDWARVDRLGGDAELAASNAWFGVATVTLSVLEEVPAAQLGDLEDPAVLETRLNTSLNGVMALILQNQQQEHERRRKVLVEGAPVDGSASAEQRDQHARELAKLDADWAADKIALTKMTFKVTPRKEFGEFTPAAGGRPGSYGAYVIQLVDATSRFGELAEFEFGVLTASVRNGAAIAEISFTGTMPEEEMRKDMDRFLRVMDEKTKMASEE